MKIKDPDKHVPMKKDAGDGRFVIVDVSPRYALEQVSKGYKVKADKDGFDWVTDDRCRWNPRYFTEEGKAKTAAKGGVPHGEPAQED